MTGGTDDAEKKIYEISDDPLIGVFYDLQDHAFGAPETLSRLHRNADRIPVQRSVGILPADKHILVHPLRPDKAEALGVRHKDAGSLLTLGLPVFSPAGNTDLSFLHQGVQGLLQLPAAGFRHVKEHRDLPDPHGFVHRVTHQGQKHVLFLF